MIQDSIVLIQDSLVHVHVDTVLIEPRRIPVADQMLERITALSDHLGITAEMLYDSYYTQYWLTKGIYGIILGVVFVLLTIVLLRMLFVKYNADLLGREQDVEIIDIFVITILATSVIVSIIIALVYFLESIPHILNPAYYATIELIKTLR